MGLGLVSLVLAQEGEIVPLSTRVGYSVDAEEREFYHLFPEITGFESAQFYEISPNRIEARIVYLRYSRPKLSRKAFNLREFTRLQNVVNRQPPITEQDRTALRENLTFLRTDATLAAIPAGQYVIIKHRDGPRVKGTLVEYGEKRVRVQTPLKMQEIPLWELARISYRPEIVDRPGLKLALFGISALAGLALAEGWNLQTRPRLEMVWHYRFLGTVLGLLAGVEAYETMTVLSSPRTHLALTAEERNKLQP